MDRALNVKSISRSRCWRQTKSRERNITRKSSDTMENVAINEDERLRGMEKLRSIREHMKDLDVST